MKYRQVTGSVLLLLLSVLEPAIAVKHENFKTCSQSGFCKRNRALADRAQAAGAAWTAPYELDEATIALKDGILTGTIWKTEDGGIELPIEVSFLDNGIARVTIDEEKRRKGDITLRHESKARKERYNEAEKWALVGGKNYYKTATMETKDGATTVTYGMPEYQVRITHKPFGLTFLSNGEAQVVLNERKLMNVEHWRPKVDKAEGEQLTEDEETYWEETFGGNTDSKPRGTA
jgi:mannosyl-oligosaccharide alpha-1,3-glucosidase